MKIPIKQWVWFLVMGGLVVSCAGLPELHQAIGPEKSETSRACPGLYPFGQWQLLHTIEAELPSDRKGFLIGLTRLSSQRRAARCVIMTLEGFVVFDAAYNGTLRVERAVAPFDKEALARGVMADIQLIFFKPPSDDIQSGTTVDGAAVCRYGLPDGSVIDVTRQDNNHWETRLYSPNHRLKRVVKHVNSEEPKKETPEGMAHTIELTALGTPGYKLVLDLVEAIPLDLKVEPQTGSE